jgi:hypothetical protein
MSYSQVNYSSDLSAGRSREGLAKVVGGQAWPVGARPWKASLGAGPGWIRARSTLPTWCWRTTWTTKKTEVLAMATTRCARAQRFQPPSAAGCLVPMFFHTAAPDRLSQRRLGLERDREPRRDCTAPQPDVARPSLRAGERLRPRPVPHRTEHHGGRMCTSGTRTWNWCRGTAVMTDVGRYRVFDQGPDLGEVLGERGGREGRGRRRGVSTRTSASDRRRGRSRAVGSRSSVTATNAPIGFHTRSALSPQSVDVSAGDHERSRRAVLSAHSGKPSPSAPRSTVPCAVDPCLRKIRCHTPQGGENVLPAYRAHMSPASTSAPFFSLDRSPLHRPRR